ncbi:MAG: phage head-tail connector protein [Pseudomonadota bacterium]
MTTNRITDAVAEAVTLDEAKAQCRVDSSEHDALLESLIAGTRRTFEQLTGRSVITTTWELVLDQFADAMPLYFPNVIAVASVKFIDTDGVEQTLDPQDYLVDTDSKPGWVVPAYGTSWPSTRAQINAVRVRYTAGYGATAADVPENVKMWMKAHIAHWFKNAESSVIGASVERLPFIDHLIDSERVWA